MVEGRTVVGVVDLRFQARGLLFFLNGAGVTWRRCSEEEEEGAREPAGIRDLSFVLLFRDPDTWGQRGLNGFILKAASDADADESAR